MIPVCATCGAWFPDGAPPARCLICDDERQWVPETGQAWTTAADLAAGHRVELRLQEPGLTGVGLEPSFGIGQRMLVVESPGGNVLWDMIPAITDEGVAAVRALGSMRAIAVSHPHYYAAASAWSDALGGTPILLHARDRAFVTRPHGAIEHWEGDELSLGGGVTLLRVGGHFEGGTVLHWADGADGRGALFTGDIVTVVGDTRMVSFMWSYPNLIPLPDHEIERIAAALEPWEYDRIYGAWWNRVIAAGAKAAVRRGVDLYLQALRRPAQPA